MADPQSDVPRANAQHFDSISVYGKKPGGSFLANADKFDSVIEGARSKLKEGYDRVPILNSAMAGCTNIAKRGYIHADGSILSYDEKRVDAAIEELREKYFAVAGTLKRNRKTAEKFILYNLANMRKAYEDENFDVIDFSPERAAGGLLYFKGRERKLDVSMVYGSDAGFV
ncbi:MAG: hypothetical protein ABIA21_03355, partial [Candidatus Aenigmatarchaeota archaeon]